MITIDFIRFVQLKTAWRAEKMSENFSRVMLVTVKVAIRF